MTKDAFWFPHDSNALGDPKVEALVAVYGFEGYGRFWSIIEKLRDQPEYRLPDEQYVTDAFAGRWRCTPEEAEKFITDCITRFKLLTRADDRIWSESLCRRMEHFDERRRKQADRAKKRWGGDATAEPQESHGEPAAEPQESHGSATALPRQSHGNALAMQEQDRTEQDKEKHQNSTSSVSAGADPALAPLPDEAVILVIDTAPDDAFTTWKADVVAAWNALPSPPFARIRQLTPERTKHLRARYGEPAFRDGFRTIIERIRGTPFLRGSNDRSWSADFDWLVKNTQNYTKILEGKYDNRTPNTSTAHAHTGKRNYCPTAESDAERRRVLGIG